MVCSWCAHPLPVATRAQGATWLYEAIVSPTLKQISTEARKVPALQKALDQLEAFTVRLDYTLVSLKHQSQPASAEAADPGGGLHGGEYIPGARVSRLLTWSGSCARCQCGLAVGEA